MQIPFYNIIYKIVASLPALFWWITLHGRHSKDMCIRSDPSCTRNWHCIHSFW